jgi:hypothetical protein
MAALSFCFLVSISSFSFAHCSLLLGAGLVHALVFAPGLVVDATVIEKRKK